MPSEETKLVHALELLDTHYHTKERALYLYLCAKYNVDAAECSMRRNNSTTRQSLSWFSGPDAMVFVDDQYHSEDRLAMTQSTVSPMERRPEPHSVATVYRERVVALYRRQYPELSCFESEEMDQILDARKLRKMLKDPDALMLAVGLEPVLSAEQKKLVHALELLTSRYSGNEHGLYSFLCQKYGVAVDAQYTVDHRSGTRFEYPKSRARSLRSGHSSLRSPQRSSSLRPGHSSLRSPKSVERKKRRHSARGLPFSPPTINKQSLTLQDRPSFSWSHRRRRSVDMERGELVDD